MTVLPTLRVASIKIPVPDIERSRTWFRDEHELSFYAVTPRTACRPTRFAPSATFTPGPG